MPCAIIRRMATPAVQRDPLTACVLLDIVERTLHGSKSEWLFLRELRLGTGRRNAGALQRVDAFALNSLPHLGMKRICYEVKTSRADFLGELRHPVKRRIGMRYSNEFYFLTPPGLLHCEDIPAECGLVEAGCGDLEEWRSTLRRRSGFFHFDAESRTYCVVTVTAPWRDTPGPTWELTAAMLRNQRRTLEERAPERPAQTRLTFG